MGLPPTPGGWRIDRSQMLGLGGQKTTTGGGEGLFIEMDGWMDGWMIWRKERNERGGLGLPTICCSAAFSSRPICEKNEVGCCAGDRGSSIPPRLLGGRGPTHTVQGSPGKACAGWGEGGRWTGLRECLFPREERPAHHSRKCCYIFPSLPILPVLNLLPRQNHVTEEFVGRS